MPTIETPKSQEVLQLCREIFPGVTWAIAQDSDDLNVRYQSYCGTFPEPLDNTEIRLVVNSRRAMADVSMANRLIIAISENMIGNTPRDALMQVKEKLMGIYGAMGVGLGLS